MNKQRTYWHGTNNKKNVERILNKGFKPDTWFAFHLEDAIKFGGKYVFEVKLDVHKPNPAYDWQILFAETIPPENIISAMQYRIDKIFTNRWCGKLLVFFE